MARATGPQKALGLLTLGTLAVVGGFGLNALRESEAPTPAEPSGTARTYDPEAKDWDATVPSSFPTPLPPYVSKAPDGTLHPVPATPDE